MKLAFLAFGLSTGAAFAHGGHVTAAGNGTAHWFTSGDHAIAIVLAIAALGLGGYILLRARTRSPATRRARS